MSRPSTWKRSVNTDLVLGILATILGLAALGVAAFAIVVFSQL